jgi:hypothetical protein
VAPRGSSSGCPRLPLSHPASPTRKPLDGRSDRRQEGGVEVGGGAGGVDRGAGGAETEESATGKRRRSRGNRALALTNRALPPPNRPQLSSIGAPPPHHALSAPATVARGDEYGCCWLCPYLWPPHLARLLAFSTSLRREAGWEASVGQGKLEVEALDQAEAWSS